MQPILEYPEFGTQRLPYVISYLRNASYNTAQNGKVRNIYSHLVRAYSKLVRKPFDVDWEGIKMRVHPNENSGDRWIFRVGIHSEYEDMQYLKELYKGKDLSVLDIGANIGVYTLFLSRILGGRSNIISFEPHPDTYQRLMTNLSFNPTSNVTALNVGIGDKKESAWLYRLNEKNAGENSLLANAEECEKVEVKLVTLAETVKERRLQKIDFLKIDIEGFEDRALIPFLENCDRALMPRHIFIEDNREQWETDCFGYFLSKGYSLVKSHKKNGNSHFMLGAS